MNTGIYALSADPFHNGHADVLSQAVESGRFSKIIVGIGINSEKKYLLSQEERVRLTRASLRPFNFQNVSIEAYTGLLAHYILDQGGAHLVRGSRNSFDFDYEKMLANFHQEQYSLHTSIIPSASHLTQVSSSLVRQAIAYGALVNNYVHPAVKESLEKHVLGVKVVGVTGNMGAGKSTYCQNLVKEGERTNVNVVHFDADRVAHSLIHGQNPRGYQIRQQLIDAFGYQLGDEDNVDRKVLGQIVFSDQKNAEKLKSILAIPFRQAFEKVLKQTKGVLLFDAAYLAEYDLESWVNYNTILVGCGELERRERVMKRDNIDLIEFDIKANVQLKYDALKNKILEEQSKVKYGFLREVDSREVDPGKELEFILTEAKL